MLSEPDMYRRTSTKEKATIAIFRIGGIVDTDPY